MEVAAAEGPAVLSALFAGLFANEQSSIYIGGAKDRTDSGELR